MRVTAKTKQATEKAIRAAARRLFVRRGIEGTSTRDIADAAGIAAGTLFNYFPSKEALAAAIAADAFDAGRAQAHARLDSTPPSLEESLFTLIAGDIRALAPIRRLVPDILETSLSPFATHTAPADVAAIRTDRLGDVAQLLADGGLAAAGTAPVMHLYWSLYLGVLSFWAADASPAQEDTWALLDRTTRMFADSLRRAPDRPAFAPDTTEMAP